MLSDPLSNAISMWQTQARDRAGGFAVQRTTEVYKQPLGADPHNSIS